jgi:plasmid stabilization system protein ParE
VAYQIRLRRKAHADIDEHFGFIGNRMGLAVAARWRDRLIARVDTLSNQPEGYSLAEEAPDLGIELREMLFGRRRQVYRILFTIDGQTANIHRVRHAAQDRLSPDNI